METSLTQTEPLLMRSGK